MSSHCSTTTTTTSVPTLKQALATALPDTLQIAVRYIHTRPVRCQPLFSPSPGSETEKTRLISHFLTVSTKDGKDSSNSGVLAYAIEVLSYSSSRLTTLFVSKADSTGYLPQSKPSSIKTISTTFLQWLSSRELLRRPDRKLVISLFGRAQGQYLFPGSIDNPKKHVLDDRQLIKWWVRVLDPLFGNDTRRRGFITVPGYQGVELRQFLPAARDNWSAGHPLRELALTRNVPEHAPTRCLLPRFPDDPKARFMLDLDDEVGLMEDAGASATTSPSKRKNGRWKAIHDIDRFWEAMEFRQECSSGRVVGFLWIVIGDEQVQQRSQATISSMHDYSQETASQSQQGSQPQIQESQSSKQGHKPKKRKLTGPITVRSPRIKGSNNTSKASSTNQFDGNGVCLTSEGYDQIMQTLLHLDFGDLDAAGRSTEKWIAEVSSISSLPKQSWILHVHGEAVSTASLTDDNAEKVNDLGSMIRKKKRPLEADDGATSLTTHVVNTLQPGLIRKKTKT